MTLRMAVALAACAMGAQAVVLDRIAANVGKEVILESDVLRDLRITAFLDQKPIASTGEAKRAAAERLANQTLILREALDNRVPPATEEEAENLLSQVKAQYPGQAYADALKKYNITEAQLKDHLIAGYRTLTFTEIRFRPEVQVTDQDLTDFYQLLAAGWRKEGNEQVPTFEQSKEQVQKLVFEQKITQALDAWLTSTRTQVGVMFRDKVFE